MDNLKLLMAACKCSVSLDVNSHRDNYQTAAAYLKERAEQDEGLSIEPDIMQKMIETDTIIKLRFYPSTPISFWKVWHYDLDLALIEALACLKK